MSPHDMQVYRQARESAVRLESGTEIAWTPCRCLSSEWWKGTLNWVCRTGEHRGGCWVRRAHGLIQTVSERAQVPPITLFSLIRLKQAHFPNRNTLLCWRLLLRGHSQVENDGTDSRNNKHQNGIWGRKALQKKRNYMDFRNKLQVKSGSNPEPTNYNKPPPFASTSLNCIANWKSQIHSRCVLHISRQLAFDEKSSGRWR